jgi:hypothetical protein
MVKGLIDSTPLVVARLGTLFAVDGELLRLSACRLCLHAHLRCQTSCEPSVLNKNYMPDSGLVSLRTCVYRVKSELLLWDSSTRSYMKT